MQFLAYIVVVLVSFSTILLELHWLTSPARQPVPIVQASAVPPSAKIDGPNVELSPVYPKPEAPRSVGSVSGSPQAATEEQAAAPAPVEAVAKEEPKKVESARTATVETKVETKVAAKPESTGAAVAAPPLVEPEKTAIAAPATQPTATKNSCDVQGCARAYTSFSAADCTYQPLQGPRQLCVKPPAQAQQKVAPVARQPNADVARERSNEQSKKAELQRAVQFLRGRKAADEADFDEPMEERGRDMIIVRRPGRW